MQSAAKDMPVFDRQYHTVLTLFTAVEVEFPPPLQFVWHINVCKFSYGISSVERNVTIRIDVVLRIHTVLYLKH
jgi:hypothetical protein